MIKINNIEEYFLNKCELLDIDRIDRFYRYVIDNTQTMSKFGKWIYGLHPTREMIEGYIKDGRMYFAEKDNIILAAVAVTPFQGDEYGCIDWQISCKNGEVSVVHILAVNPDYQKSGIAKSILQSVIEIAKKSNSRAIRLDALSCNAPAHKLYQSMGFLKIGSCNWYACNVGWTDFYLYELLL